MTCHNSPAFNHMMINLANMNEAVPKCCGYVLYMSHQLNLSMSLNAIASFIFGNLPTYYNLYCDTSSSLPLYLFMFIFIVFGIDMKDETQ